MQEKKTKKAAHWEKKSGNTLGTFAELRVLLLQELHRLPQRRPARLQFLVLLPQLRNPNGQTPKENTPRKKARQERNKTGCGAMVRRGRVNYLRAARVGAAYAGYGGGGGGGRELGIQRGCGLWRFRRHGVAARVRWRRQV